MRKSNYYYWVFLFPALFAFLMVMVIPFFLGTYYSFTNWDGIKTSATFVGFENFKNLFIENPRFIYSIIITFFYSTFNIIIINVVALGLALLVTQNIKFKNFYRASFFLPNMIGGLILGYVWQFIFNRAMPSIMTNDFLMLGGRNTALFAIIITGTWQYAGYIMVIYVTAISNIPKELLEASLIDGANAGKRMRHIMIPMLAPAFTITTFLTLMYSFKQFDVNFSLTGGGPSTMFMEKAINGTELIAMNIFNEAFVFNNMAVAQAKSVLFFLALVTFSTIQVHFNKKREVEM